MKLHGTTERAKSAYKDLVLRNATQGGFAQGRYAEMFDDDWMPLAPFWRYVAVRDARTRPAHAALHGRVFRKDDATAHRYLPLWDHNCRCMPVSLTLEEFQQGGFHTTSGADVESLPTKDGKFVGQPEGSWNVDRAAQAQRSAVGETEAVAPKPPVASQPGAPPNPPSAPPRYTGPPEGGKEIRDFVDLTRVEGRRLALDDLARAGFSERDALRLIHTVEDFTLEDATGNVLTYMHINEALTRFRGDFFPAGADAEDLRRLAAGWRIQQFLGAVPRLPLTRGTWRKATHFNAEDAAKIFYVGREFGINAFWSASGLSDLFPDRQVIFEIRKPLSGVAISHISTNAPEMEALFPVGSRFRVTGSSREGDRITVVIEEVP